ncbi:uncharacterized protein LOC101861810, partial [Aplysia californica]|uniref:Uncharacterized protein LOC101861810 n=1 Tax=Aplysia californica TaxID=6500 RepID=A0ABM0ZYP8_APLCA
MACSRHGSRRCEYSRVLVLLLTMASCVCHVDSQTGEETEVASESADAAKKLEETVFTDMLRIVDHKFDTLTTRITALERAVSNLQFFSIRQFRQLSGSIQSTENDLEAVGNQVGQLEVNGRALKIAMTLLSRDMTDLKSTTNGMLGELESSVVYINDNVEKQAGLLKTVVEDTVLRSTRDITTQLGRRIEKLGRRQQKAQPESVNCTVDFSELNERIDLRFAMFKKETHNHFVKLIDAAQLNIRGAPEGKKESKDEPEEVPELETINEGKRVSEKSEKKLSSLTKKGKPSISAQEQREEGITTETPSSSGRYRYSDEYNETYYEENDQRIMRALTNMTSSVLQAVNYFRHTGRMLEQIMSNTDNLVSSQTDLMRKVEGLESLAFPQKTTGKSGEISNAIPGSQHQTQGDEGSTSRPLTGSSPDHCIVSNDLVNNMATIAKNGSQLLEVLTDLAQMSSVSLAQTTAALQDEVKRVEGVRTRMATTMLARSTGDKSDPVTQLTNTTQRIFKLVEAVASNTGWLPLIFRNVQHVETLGNRSLEFVTRNHAILRDLQRLSSEANARLDESAASPEPTISNKIPRIPEGRATGAPENTAPSEGAKEELVLDQESLETIYSTSLQLNRIMPALTKLLAEPDPLFTLVGGGRPDQGRVEIYNKGQWGTICHRE